jgi:adenosine/AMP kinase
LNERRWPTKRHIHPNVIRPRKKLKQFLIFIKTVEDLYEAVVTGVPQAKFGLGFNESSGACLTRAEGNDQALRDVAVCNAQVLGCGHVFVLVLQNAYPINVLNAIRNVPEVCSIFCATANPIEGIVAQSEQGRGVLGVIDGRSPKGVEGPTDVTWRGCRRPARMSRCVRH